jgi:acyl-coenzyme A thioesterase PaaI-like protein
VRYHHPLPTGSTVEARAHEAERRGKLVRVESEVRTTEGTLVASGLGKFMLV